MKKTLLALTIALAANFAQVATAQTASANELPQPAWLCTMNFKGTGAGIQFILGAYRFQGKGTIHCLGALGETAVLPVKVTMKSAPISPTISFGAVELIGQTAEVALLNYRPEDMLGNYLVAEGQGAIFGGIGAFAAVKASIPDLAVKVSVQFAKGFGINLGLHKMKVELDQDRL